MAVRFISARSDRPQISWHRGGKELATSASLDAFIAAAQHGAEYVEVDVRCTADCVLVCVHDASLPLRGPVDQLRWSDLSAGDRSQILTAEQLRDALAQIDSTGRTGIHLDLKGEGYEVRAVDVLGGGNRPLFVTTPQDHSVSVLRRARPDAAVYLTIGTSREGLSRRAVVRLRLSELFPQRRLNRCDATGIAIHHALANQFLLWWCRQRHLAIVVWTVDRPALVERWLSRDIDVLTTNRPLFALGRRAARNSTRG